MMRWIPSGSKMVSSPAAQEKEMTKKTRTRNQKPEQSHTRKRPAGLPESRSTEKILETTFLFWFLSSQF
jgi:hypothetical protein